MCCCSPIKRQSNVHHHPHLFWISLYMAGSAPLSIPKQVFCWNCRGHKKNHQSLMIYPPPHQCCESLNMYVLIPLLKMEANCTCFMLLLNKSETHCWSVLEPLRMVAFYLYVQHLFVCDCKLVHFNAGTFPGRINLTYQSVRHLAIVLS